ncbi:hypothetical protein J7E38_19015 [Bacillus sp. ISL-35]|uniref:CsxC family protein n=1 Tax=Bacillus sp. ISL-35 TaxID=2819122 RepID=UPI001BEC3EBA|nr:hypothetical protein [Bacillus sp. ISL-35]MBT2681086.1 hypothetical protein [Bacillus sp. ISL-35]MBT2705405.1 hypothetical protein [Chryseobacterium sp. ISL-80]
MRKNTGCNTSHGCPPQTSCDKAKTLRVDCDNVSSPPSGTDLTYNVADVDVPLAVVDLQVDVESDIDLPTPAREIKHMRRNVSLTQCKAIISSMNSGVVKVYVSGIVHKNIQYVEKCSGYVKDFSVDVPFTCIQPVDLFNYPSPELWSKKNSVKERRFIDKKGMGADNCTAGAYTYEYYNDPIECKLLFSSVNDIDLYKDFDNWGRFSRITEKMEVILTFKLLQKQQVNLGYCSAPEPALDESSSSSS